MRRVSCCDARCLALASLVAVSACQREPAASNRVAAPSASGRPSSAPSAPAAASFAAREPDTSGPAFGCDELPILGVYRGAGLVREANARRVVLDLEIDLHMQDCGAPDGYGERLTVALDVEPSGESCLLRAASISSKPFGDEGIRGQPWRDQFDAEHAPVDLAAPALQRITLRGRATPRAVIIGHKQPWLFDSITPDAPLLLELAGEESDRDCCYGFTTARSFSWDAEHYRSGFSLDVGLVDEADRARLNRWATNHGLRHDLELLVRRGFELEGKPQIELELSAGTPPMAATVRLGETPRASEALSQLLHFSRKPCATCRGGVSGWWLWDSKQQWWCPSPSGKLELSDDLCQ